MAEDRLQLTFFDQADDASRALIHQKIRAFNDAVSEHHRAIRVVGPSPLDLLLRDGPDQIVGGLVGATYWGWLDIHDLWIDDRYRGQGYGRQLMETAESEAIARGCTCAQVKTFSFQARGFYEKLGYYMVGRLDDYPPGQALFWMRKDLPVDGKGGLEAG